MNVTFIKSAFKKDHYPPADKPEIAFAGRSNVGKSSLLNVLVRRKKTARTSSTPGRTQAINFFLVDDRMHFVDLPGYGFARVPIRVKKTWGKMVEEYLRLRSNLKGVVVILDIRRDPASGDLDLLHWLKTFNMPAIIVLTKADKLSRQKARNRTDEISAALENYGYERPTLFSAKTGMGRDDIWERIRGLSES